MVLVSEFFPRVLPYVPGCSEPMAAQALVDAAVSFCDTSLALRLSLDPITTVSGQRFADLDMPTGTTLARLIDVRIDDRQLGAMSYDDGQPALGNTASGKPSMYYISRADETLSLALFPLPDKAYTINATVAVKPVRNTKTLHNDLHERWLDAIVAGALSRLHAVPSQPFSDPAQAAMQYAKHDMLTKEARREASFNRVRATSMVRMHPFA